MSRSDFKYVAVPGVAVLTVIAVVLLAPEPVDWTESYARDDERPYGSRILYELLPALFPDADVTPINVSPYLVLRDARSEQDAASRRHRSTVHTRANYLFITDILAPDPATVEELLVFVADGGTVFAAAHAFEGALADSLHLEMDATVRAQQAGDSLRLHFSSPSLQRPGGYAFGHSMAHGFFSRFDTSRATVLGTNGAGEVTYVRMNVGTGAFYLSATPRVFTNYALLTGPGAAYAYRALSYLPVQEVWWDAYYKPGRLQATSPLRYILATPALRAAYWLLLVTILLFILFEGKRRQRVIPAIAPLRNDTLDFVQTVGRLYYRHGDHRRLAEKKISHFMEYVRSHLDLSLRDIEEGVIERVAERSGVPIDEVQVTFRRIQAVQAKDRLTEDGLKKLNVAIDTFYQKSQR